MRNKKSKRTSKNLDFLRENGIIVSDDFGIKLDSIPKRIIPPLKTIEATLNMCNYWRSFFESNQEFSKMVCDKVFSMYAYQAAVISTNSGLKTSISNYRLRKKLPECIITIVDEYGQCFIQKGFGKEREKVFF